MELPPGPPSLGESPPPPSAERYAEDEVEVVEPDPHDGLLADEDANRRLVATTAALALIAVAVMIGVFLLTDRDHADTQAAPPAPIVTLPTPTTVEPPPEIDQAELDEVIDRATDFVAEQRGLEFEDDVEVVVVSRQDYQELAREAFDAQADELRGYLLQHAQVYQALGFWPAGADPVSLTRELRALSTVAFYDHVEQRVVMGVPELNTLFELVLVHELTHALDDQHFGIHRSALFGRSDEAAMAFEALVEGDARRIELAYQATLTDQERADLTAESAAATPELDPAVFPDVLQLEQDVVVGQGQAFVQALWDEGGSAQLDRAFRRPPRSTEEILEPDAYLDGSTTTEVQIPVPDAQPAAEGVVGQAVFDWMTVLGRAIDEPMAEWNGDRYVLWPEGDHVCVRIEAVGDVSGLQAQLEEWAEVATAEVTVTDGRLSITACR